MLHLLCPLVVCGECPESGSSGLGVATSTRREFLSLRHPFKAYPLEHVGGVSFRCIWQPFHGFR